MLVKIPMMSLKLTSLKPADNLHILFLVIVTALSAFFLHWLAVPIMFVAYIALSLVFKSKLP